MTDTRDAMILTKLSKAQNEVIRIWIPKDFDTRHTDERTHTAQS